MAETKDAVINKAYHVFCWHDNCYCGYFCSFNVQHFPDE